MSFSIKRKDKRKTRTYTLYKIEEEDCDIYKLADDNAKNVITTHDMTFMLNFIMRLKDSGYVVKLGASFCNKDMFNDDCAGCVLYTQCGCLLLSEKE